MKTLNRYEIGGIAVSVAAAVAVLAVSRFYPFSSPYHTAQSAEITDSDIITVNSQAKDQTAAIRQALIDGSTAGGHVIKLIIADARIGAGREVRIGDTVTVNYVAVQKDGPEFDNTYTKGKPLSFRVGAGEVITGLERGIIGMKEGGKRILVVPPGMAYGDTPVDSLPAHATLIFSIEIVTIE